ncbi:hypothetical protein PR048_031330 [Dryococelus australis]|uniref:Uncharacterized protein n=1 Tax=Dryococelus australis TaxID=614101 RepID=A0ABQ9G5N9_9NEOP|nr:hypothetical protein PR048_031330 [Dryococelus australis]
MLTPRWQTTCPIAVDSGIDKLYTIPPGHSYADLLEKFPGILQKNPSFITPKKDGLWGPRVNYRALIDVTKPGRYLVPHLQDFNNALHVQKAYWKILDHMGAITEYPIPKAVTELRHFLGVINFYRHCLPNSVTTQAALLKFIPDS